MWWKFFGVKCSDFSGSRMLLSDTTVIWQIADVCSPTASQRFRPYFDQRDLGPNLGNDLSNWTFYLLLELGDERIWKSAMWTPKWHRNDWTPPTHSPDESCIRSHIRSVWNHTLPFKNNPAICVNYWIFIILFHRIPGSHRALATVWIPNFGMKTFDSKNRWIINESGANEFELLSLVYRANGGLKSFDFKKCFSRGCLRQLYKWDWRHYQCYIRPVFNNFLVGYQIFRWLSHATISNRNFWIKSFEANYS